MAHCGNRKLYVRSRFTFYNLLPSSQPQKMMGDNVATNTEKYVFFLDLFGIPVRYPESCYQSVPLWELAPSLVSSQQEIDPEIPKTYPAKCSMLAMLISNEMWPRSHPCTHPHSSLWICECETWDLASALNKTRDSAFSILHFPGNILCAKLSRIPI